MIFQVKKIQLIKKKNNNKVIKAKRKKKWLKNFQYLHHLY